MDDFIEELKAQIIETLALEDVTPADIDPEGQLVGGDLGIDSIDVLELVMMVGKGIRRGDRQQGAGRPGFRQLEGAGRLYPASAQRGTGGWLTGNAFFISGMGIVSPMGLGVDATLKALQRAATGIRPLTLFPCPV